MKPLYFLVASALAMCLFVNQASAQYTGGTYTAVRDGSWAATGIGNVWDVSGHPPARCANCHVIIADGFTVTMDADITLSGNSLVSVGTDGTSTTNLNFSFSSAVAPNSSIPFPIPSVYHRISMVYGDPVTIKVSNANSRLDASVTGVYDGVFLAVPTPGGISEFNYIARLNTTAAYPNATGLTGPGGLGSVGTLPILLSEFNAVLVGKSQVELSWTTQLEVNSDHFGVQRSTDGGSHWATIGNVAAKGNSSLAAHYSYTDGLAAAGVSQYRLQSIDKDGKFAFSNIKVIRTNLISGVSIFPNPAKDYVNVNLGVSGDAASTLSVRLISQSGQVLVERKLNNAGGSILSLPVGNYPQGNYLIMVTGADGSKQVSKLFISRQ